MTDEPRYVFTLSELRAAFKEMQTIGRSDERHDPVHADKDLNIDFWLERNGSNFQLEEPVVTLPFGLIPLRNAFQAYLDEHYSYLPPQNPLRVIRVVILAALQAETMAQELLQWSPTGIWRVNEHKTQRRE